MPLPGLTGQTRGWSPGWAPPSVPSRGVSPAHCPPGEPRVAAWPPGVACTPLIPQSMPCRPRLLLRPQGADPAVPPHRAEEASGERGAEESAAEGGLPDQDPGVPEGVLHSDRLPGGHHHGEPVPADVHVRRAEGRLPHLQGGTLRAPGPALPSSLSVRTTPGPRALHLKCSLGAEERGESQGGALSGRGCSWTAVGGTRESPEPSLLLWSGASRPGPQGGLSGASSMARALPHPTVGGLSSSAPFCPPAGPQSAESGREPGVQHGPLPAGSEHVQSVG